MFKRYYRRNQSLSIKSEINITPLIDVMTVLMAVFMITAPLLTSGINVDLPSGGKSTLSGNATSVDISISKNGHMFLGKNKISSFKRLISKINAMKKENPNISIIISGDKKVNYGRVVEVMGKLKDAGYQKIGLKTIIDNN